MFAATKDSRAEHKGILRQKMTKTLKEEVTHSVEVTSSPIPFGEKSMDTQGNVREGPNKSAMYFF
jgi:hypothetical protein